MVKKVIVYSCVYIMSGCYSNDYGSNNHSYQDLLPDYWDSYKYDRNYYNRLDRIEKRHKKRFDMIEKDYMISKKKSMELYKSDLEFEDKSKETPKEIRKNQEFRVKRDKRNVR